MKRIEVFYSSLELTNEMQIFSDFLARLIDFKRNPNWKIGILLHSFLFWIENMNNFFW
jgi:hypothetical protein